MTTFNGCLIFHVFNTLTERNVDLALESLVRQPFRWRGLLIYNAATQPHLQNDTILPKVRAALQDRFDTLDIFPYDPSTPKTITADFLVQFRDIAGYAAYLLHKADFYLGPQSIRALEEAFGPKPADQVRPAPPAFVNFKKFDLREYVSDERVRTLAREPTYTRLLEHPNVEPWETGMFNLSCEAIGYTGLDGVTHAYNDAARACAFAPEDEIHREWGYCSVFDQMISRGAHRIEDDRCYALHVYHEVPAKTGPAERMQRGYRF